MALIFEGLLLNSTSVFRCLFCVFVFFFKQKTAYEMRISDWSSDVCSSDLDFRLAADIDHAIQRTRSAERLAAHPIFGLIMAAGLLRDIDMGQDRKSVV